MQPSVRVLALHQKAKRMKAIYFCLGLVALLSCQPDPLPDEQTSDAVVIDTSAWADGCEPYVAFGTALPIEQDLYFKPTDQSRPRVLWAILKQREAGAYIIPVQVRFRKTGRQAKVVCGWNNLTVDEIDVIAIKTR